MTPAVLVKAMLLNKATSGVSQRAIDPTELDRDLPEPLVDPLMRKFPVGRWAWPRPGVRRKYSVENGRAVGQRADVTTLRDFFGWFYGKEPRD